MKSKYQLISTFLLAASLSYGAHPKMARDLDQVDPTSTVDVIVQFKDVPTVQTHQRLLARSARHKLALPSIRSSAMAVHASDLNLLADSPDVEFVYPDRKVSTTSYEYAPTAVNANLAWAGGFDASTVGVAVIDSGINSKHPDLSTGMLFQSGATSRVVYEQSFVSGDSSTADSFGHGTHVAGLIAGNGASSTGAIFTSTIRGIGSNIRLINLRVLDANGGGSDSAVIAAIQQAIALKSKYNIRVINLSLGRPVMESYKTDLLCQAAESAYKAGIVVVVAAGNEGRNNSFGTNGYGLITSPGNDPYVITVGAMRTMGTVSRTDDLITSYSSKGPRRSITW